MIVYIVSSILLVEKKKTNENEYLFVDTEKHSRKSDWERKSYLIFDKIGGFEYFS